AERVFRPAGMRESRFRRAEEIVPNRASGYVDRNGVLLNGEPLRPAILAPNGLILSTAADMARWSIALTNGTLLKRASLNVMATPVRLNDGSSFNGAGIGWFFDAFHGHRMMLH